MPTPSLGDTVIIRRAPQQFDVLDVATNEILGTRATLTDALVLAAQCYGSVWQQAVDEQGRYVGEPVLILPQTECR